jgi:hypothetical protein
MNTKDVPWTGFAWWLEKPWVSASKGWPSAYSSPHQREQRRPPGLLGHLTPNEFVRQRQVTRAAETVVFSS